MMRLDGIEEKTMRQRQMIAIIALAWFTLKIAKFY
jgi:hypothetical protein